MTGESRRFGAQGGKKRAANLSKEELSEGARRAALVRWGGNLPIAEYPGVLEIGDLSLPCAVLSDGTRVLTETEFMKAMRMYRSGALSVRRARGAREPLYLAFKNLKPFVDKHLSDVHTQSLPFKTLSGNIAHGIRAEIIVHVCNVWLDAHAAGVLGPRQVQVAEKAQVLKDALAKHAINELVDEVTGFKESSDRQAIARFLRAYVNTDLRDWVSTFPRSFFEQLCRLKNVPFPKENMRLPQYFGTIINELVYARIAPGVLPELRAVNPVVGPKGRRRAKHHQFMTDKIGHPKLLHLVGRIEGIAYGFEAGEYDAFKRMVDIRIHNYGAEAITKAADIPRIAGAAHARVRLPPAASPEQELFSTAG